jgi:hypothetical protein
MHPPIRNVESVASEKHPNLKKGQSPHKAAQIMAGVHDPPFKQFYLDTVELNENA